MLSHGCIAFLVTGQNVCPCWKSAGLFVCLTVQRHRKSCNAWMHWISQVGHKLTDRWEALVAGAVI
jgi:hypothetical protein